MSRTDELKLLRYIQNGPRNRGERREMARLVQQKELEVAQKNLNPNLHANFDRKTRKKHAEALRKLKNHDSKPTEAIYDAQSAYLKGTNVDEYKKAREREKLAKEALKNILSPNAWKSGFTTSEEALAKGSESRAAQILKQYQAEQKRLAEEEKKYDKEWEKAQNWMEKTDISNYERRLREQERAEYLSEQFEESVDDILIQRDKDIQALEDREVAEMFSDIKRQERADKYLDHLESEQQKGDYLDKARAGEVNDMLEYASSLYGGNKEYGKILKAMMKEMLGDNSYQPGKNAELDDNEYFKILPGYSGKLAELFKYVVFKKIPDEFIGDVDDIRDLPWSSYENYFGHQADILHQRFRTIYDNPDIDVITYDVIEAIMQSSAAWHIAIKKGEPDSDQIKAAYQELCDKAKEVVETGDNNFIEDFIAMIQNEEDFDYIIDIVNLKIMKAWMDD